MSPSLDSTSERCGVVGSFDRLLQYRGRNFFDRKQAHVTMGRSAKIVRSSSYERVKKMNKGQAWRYVRIVSFLFILIIRESGSRQIRLEKKSARQSHDDIMTGRNETEHTKLMSVKY